jgi:hypothetical protein
MAAEEQLRPGFKLGEKVSPKFAAEVYSLMGEVLQRPGNPGS